ncbi:unnamed protein product, partial [Tuber aestivum]
FNAAVYTTLAANDFVVTAVTNNHFEQPTYSNATESLPEVHWEAYNFTGWSRENENARVVQLYNRVLKGYKTNAQRYEDLTPAECTKLYNTDFMSSHRNLYLITKDSSNSTHNNTLLGMAKVEAGAISPSDWMCYSYIIFIGDFSAQRTCNANNIASEVAKGMPWRVHVVRGEVEISGCRSEKIPEKCKVKFSLGIMIAVICCNLIKACSMIMAVTRSREPTLVTLGDALESFLRTPDQETMGMCFADQTFVKRKWRSGLSIMPEQWKVKGVQRWWTSVSQTRWVTCNFFCLIVIIAAALLLRSGMAKDGKYLETDITSMQ